MLRRASRARKRTTQSDTVRCMKTRPFGPTGVSLSVIGLGGMPMSIQGRPDEAQSLRTIHAALDAGMTLIDTANVYCLDDSDIGHNERLIAKGIATWSGAKSAIHVATKGGLARPRGAWTSSARPAALRSACEKSLAALGVSRIWVYQLHAPDPDVPLEDSVGELAKLKAEGKIEHVGLSNVDVAEIDRARKIVPIVSVQNRMNPHDQRSIKNGVLAHCEKNGIAFLPYSPVGGGRGKTKIAADDVLARIGRKHGATPPEVAIAWCAQVSPVCFPIPGASKPESAISSARAADVTLDAADMKVLGLG
jgi:aryl-alcohol dehydrogenase-like predicted oxidoreductase